VDFSTAYKLNDHASITANALNLLDETYFSYSGSKNAPTAYYKNGRVFTLGISYKL
jgi:iron complex outermembrane receptor protein